MHTNLRNGLILATFAALNLLAGPAPAAPSNVRGTITSVDGNILAIKQRDGSDAKVRLADNATIVSVAPAKLADIKPGTFIGTAATPRTDGTLQAIEIHIFPESMRGTGEGTRGWDVAPKSSMTNGTVQRAPKVANNKVNAVSGNTVTVDYNGGSKVVTVTPSTRVVTLVPGSRNDLKPNERVFIAGATKAPDGEIEARRITVGKGGATPPM